MVHPASRVEDAMEGIEIASVSCSQGRVSMHMDSVLTILETTLQKIHVGQEESGCCREAVVKGHVVYNRFGLEEGVGAKNSNSLPRLSSQFLALKSALGTNPPSSVGPTVEGGLHIELH